MTRIRVLLVDDHAMLRAGLRMLINNQPDMTVVGEASDGAGAKTALKREPADVAVVDLSMPGTDSPRLIEEIGAEHPGTRVLVLTMHDEREYLRSSMGAGASGFLVKKAADTDLITAIRSVHEGRTFVDASVRRPDDSIAPESDTRTRKLSRREREVLELLALGFSYEQVGRRLSVTPKTVETYRTRLARKLGVSTRAALVAYALKTGLLEGATRGEVQALSA